MIFDDEFNGSSLDTSNWSTGWFGSGITAPVNSEELECYDPAQVVEGAGELDLNLIAQSETCGGQTRPYASGLVSTAGKFTFTYGYVEVRAWLPGGSTISDWPGIWTDGQSWPTDGELDLVEGLGGQACWHFHDSQGAPGGCEPGSSYTGGWHTYGADWEPGSVTYYYDGTVVGTITTGITSAPMYLVLDLAADNEYGGPVAAPATLRIDYVRVWQQAS
jgi:beta-glucanase (GH16 family)